MQAGVTIRIADEMYEISLAELRRLSGEELTHLRKSRSSRCLAVLFERYHRLVLEIALKILRESVAVRTIGRTLLCPFCVLRN